MAIRTYECKECEYSEDLSESIHVIPTVKKCPNCEKEAFRVVILNCPRLTVNEVKTVGQLAEKNWKKMGHYEREEKMEADGHNATLRRREKQREVNEINKLTPEQKTKYIMTGKK